MLYQKIEKRMKETLEKNPEYQKLKPDAQTSVLNDQMEQFADFLFISYVQQQNSEHDTQCGDDEGGCCGGKCHS